MERNRTPNPEFVEWMRHRIKLAGEEIIKRADLFTAEGLDAMTSLEIHVTIPTLTEIDRWPSIAITVNCDDVQFVDAEMSGRINPYPPEQFISLSSEIEEKIARDDEEETDESSV